MKPHLLDDLQVEYLKESHNLSLFHCKNDDLNDFLKNDAKKSQDDLISRTYLCLRQNSIIGYLTIVTDTIEVKLIERDDAVDGYPYPRYPAIKIARLAVDEEFEGRGIGRFLLFWATGKVYQLSNEVGCRYITLDSKREALGFYQKFGFKLIGKYAARSFPLMYFNMYPIVLQSRQEPGL
jgi:ribosomal protein S18 acetylase RimI-like enzyme